MGQRDLLTATAGLTERVRVPERAVDVVRQVPGVRAAVADIVFPVTVRGAGSVGRPWEAAQLAPHELRNGRAPDRSGEVVLAGQGVPGARVSVSVGGVEGTYTVVGVADGPAGGVYFSAAEARRLAGYPGAVDAIGIVAERGVGTGELQARVRHALDAAGIEDAVAAGRADGDPGTLRVLAGDGRGAAEFLDAAPARMGMLQLLASVGATVLLIAGLVVSSTVVQALQQRADELRLLRAVGATPRQLRVALGREVRRVAAWAALVGAAGAVPAALGLRALLQARGAVPEGLELPLPIWLFAVVLVTAGVTVLVARAAVLFAVAWVGKVRPAEALRGAGPGRGRFVTGCVLLAVGVSSAGTAALQHGEAAAAAAGAAAVTMVIGCALLGPWIAQQAMRVLGAPLRRLGGAGGYLAAAHCAASARRFGAALTPIILVTAFVSIQLAAGATFTHQGGAQAREALRADLAVTAGDGASGGGISDRTLERIRQVPGVRAATGIAHSTVFLARREVGDPQLDRLPVLGVTPEGLEHTLDPGVTDGSLRDLRPGTVAVGAERARSLGAYPGSTVTVRFGDGAQAHLRVTAVYERSLALGDFLFSRDELIRHMSAPVTDRVLIASNDAASVAAALTSAAPGTRVESDPAPEQVQADDQALGNVLTVAAVAAIGGFTVIAVLSTLTLITVGRRPEFGLLRLAGAGRAQLRCMLRLEAAVLAVVGLAVGAAVASVPLLAFSLGTVRTLPYLPPAQAGGDRRGGRDDDGRRGAAARTGSPARTLSPFLLCLVQVGQHREHPPVPAVTRGQPQFREDIADVLADRPLRHHQRPGDRRVVDALGHQLQNLALTWGEGVQRVVAPPGQQFGDHLRVEGRAAGRDPLQGVQELVDPPHPVLEQIADSARAAGQQFDGVGILDVLRQHQYRQTRDLLPGCEGGAQALVAEVRRQAYVEDGDVRAVAEERGQHLGAADRDGHHLVARRGQQQDQALPEQGIVLGDHHTHGSSTWITVGPSAGLVTSIVPSRAATRRRMPSSPVPAASSAPPRPSSRTEILNVPGTRASRTLARVDPLCFAAFVRASATTKYAAASTAAGARGPSIPSTHTVTSSPLLAASARTAPTRPRSVRIGGWMPRTHVPQFRQRLLGVVLRLVQQLAGGLGVTVVPPPRKAQPHRQRHQARLCPVVQIPLDAA